MYDKIESRQVSRGGCALPMALQPNLIHIQDNAACVKVKTSQPDPYLACLTDVAFRLHSQRLPGR